MRDLRQPGDPLRPLRRSRTHGFVSHAYTWFTLIVSSRARENTPEKVEVKSTRPGSRIFIGLQGGQCLLDLEKSGGYVGLKWLRKIEKRVRGRIRGRIFLSHNCHPKCNPSLRVLE